MKFSHSQLKQLNVCSNTKGNANVCLSLVKTTFSYLQTVRNHCRVGVDYTLICFTHFIQQPLTYVSSYVYFSDFSAFINDPLNGLYLQIPAPLFQLIAPSQFSYVIAFSYQLNISKGHHKKILLHKTQQSREY